MISGASEEELKITKEDLALWLDRPPSNDDLDLCAYLEKALENQHNYYQEIKQLQQENKILRENAEHNDKVVDKVNWKNQLLKKENKQLKDNWNRLKEQINNSGRSFKNRCYDLVCDIDEVPKEQLTNFVTYLAYEVMKELIEKIELEQGSDNNGQ
nr:MAG TPA: hypothetical protein [Caudoviricetes sp.]